MEYYASVLFYSGYRESMVFDTRVQAENQAAKYAAMPGAVAVSVRAEKG